MIFNMLLHMNIYYQAISTFWTSGNYSHRYILERAGGGGGGAEHYELIKLNAFNRQPKFYK